MRTRKYAAMLFLISLFSPGMSGQGIHFENTMISNSVALHPMVFDVQRDGQNDIVVVDDYVDAEGNDAVNIKTICWFSALGKAGGEGYRRQLIARINYRACGMASADIDGDGYTDIVGRYDTDGDDLNETGQVFWMKNPYGVPGSHSDPWEKQDIGFSPYAKDILTADFNGDGKTDVVARCVDGFVRVYVQQSPEKWKLIKIEAPHHDGTAISDMDRDGDPDIVINGLWFETPADLYKGMWTRHDFAPRWYQQKTGLNGKWFDNNTRLAVRDIDGDGWPDVFISNAENTGYAICWYRNPGQGPETLWEEHVVAYMNYAHTLEIADMDCDGDLDLVSGELIPYHAPNPEGVHPVILFLNRGDNEAWEKQVLSEEACYGGRVGDVDNDGDMDFVAPRNWNKAPLYLWRNQTSERLDLSSIHISDTVVQGIACLKIETASATYLYDKAGGGFMSMIDHNGRDWIGFKKEDYPFPGNAASRYRGIPNLGIGGEDKDAGHPGFNQCSTKVISPNVIETSTLTGNWIFRWAFYDSHAKLTMVKTLRGMPYWFLYEGTPAGSYDPGKMYWGNPMDGRRDDFPDLLQQTGAYNNLDWLYVGQAGYPRILYFRKMQADEKTDLFSYMGNTKGPAQQSPDGMVCFGFGRAHHTTPILEGPDQEFVIGFIDREVKTALDHQYISTYINH